MGYIIIYLNFSVKIMKDVFITRRLELKNKVLLLCKNKKKCLEKYYE